MASGTKRSRRGRIPHPVITTARPGRSNDLERRQRHYLIAMSFRVLCFIAMIFAPGPARIVLLVAAAVLPAIAVLIANAVDKRTSREDAVEPGAPEHRQALPRDSTDVVHGEVVDD